MPPDIDHVFRVVREVACSLANLEAEEVTLETHIYEDLALDSQDVVELIVELEERFNIHITDEEAQQWRADKMTFTERPPKQPNPYSEPAFVTFILRISSSILGLLRLSDIIAMQRAKRHASWEQKLAKYKKAHTEWLMLNEGFLRLAADRERQIVAISHDYGVVPYSIGFICAYIHRNKLS
jgi:acyl carrier protein